MPITLAQAQVNSANDIDYAVIDNLRRSSWLMDQLVFDDTATPGTGGGSLVYGYVRLVTAAAAGFRAFNTEYTPGQATRTQQTVALKPLGGSFTVDKKLANLGPQQSNETSFQMQQLITSTRIRLCQEIVNGDTAVDANGFDGLSKSLVGSTTEVTATVPDWTPATVVTQALAMARLDEVDEWLSRIVPSHTGGGDNGTVGALPPGVKAILGNTKSITREARAFFASGEAAKAWSAVALLSRSSVTTMMANIYFAVFGGQNVPTKLFTEEAEAIAWLKGLRA